MTKEVEMDYLEARVRNFVERGNSQIILVISLVLIGASLFAGLQLVQEQQEVRRQAATKVGSEVGMGELPPGGSLPTNTPAGPGGSQLPTNTPTNRELCLASGGSWREFPNSCVDSCAYATDPSMQCAQVLTPGCDCGSSRCWSNSNKQCQANSSSNPTNTPALPGGGCNDVCLDNNGCAGDLICWQPTVEEADSEVVLGDSTAQAIPIIGNRKYCRNPDCPEDNNCDCQPNPTSTPIVSAECSAVCPDCECEPTYLCFRFANCLDGDYGCGSGNCCCDKSAPTSTPHQDQPVPTTPPDCVPNDCSRVPNEDEVILSEDCAEVVKQMIDFDCDGRPGMAEDFDACMENCYQEEPVQEDIWGFFNDDTFVVQKAGDVSDDARFYIDGRGEYAGLPVKRLRMQFSYDSGLEVEARYGNDFGHDSNISISGGAINLNLTAKHPSVWQRFPRTRFKAGSLEVKVNQEGSIRFQSGQIEACVPKPNPCDGCTPINIPLTDFRNQASFYFGDKPELSLKNVWLGGMEGNVSGKVYLHSVNEGKEIEDIQTVKASLTVDGNDKGEIDVPANGNIRSFDIGIYSFYEECSGQSDTIEVCIDSRDQVDEVNENNNCQEIVERCREPEGTPTLPVNTPPQGCKPCPNGTKVGSRADYDCNGQVNELDFAGWYDDFRSGSNLLYADFNCDDIVNEQDFAQWYDEYR